MMVNLAKAGEEPVVLRRRFEIAGFQENGWQERYDGRLSRTVLRGTGGETPPVYPTVLSFHKARQLFADPIYAVISNYQFVVLFQ